MQYSNHLAKTEFMESHRYLIVGVVGNLLLMCLLIIPEKFTFLNSTHAHFSLFSAIYILIIQQFFDCKNQKINLILFGFYLLIWIIEITTLGLPEGIANMTDRISKGFLGQLALGLSPLIYVFARLFTSVLILMLIYKRWKFRENLIWK